MENIDKIKQVKLDLQAIFEKVVNFISSASLEIENSSLFLSGNWGIGKTFLINQIINDDSQLYQFLNVNDKFKKIVQNKETYYCYVSLLGCCSYESIIYEIASALKRDRKRCWSKRMIKTFIDKTTSRSINIGVSAGYKNFSVGPSVSYTLKQKKIASAPLSSKRKNRLFKNTIFIFDDVERALSAIANPLEIKRIFTLLYKIIALSNNTKSIIVVNNNKFDKNIDIAREKDSYDKYFLWDKNNIILDGRILFFYFLYSKEWINKISSFSSNESKIKIEEFFSDGSNIMSFIEIINKFNKTLNIRSFNSYINQIFEKNFLNNLCAVLALKNDSNLQFVNSIILNSIDFKLNNNISSNRDPKTICSNTISQKICSGNLKINEVSTIINNLNEFCWIFDSINDYKWISKQTEMDKINNYIISNENFRNIFWTNSIDILIKLLKQNLMFDDANPSVWNNTSKQTNKYKTLLTLFFKNWNNELCKAVEIKQNKNFNAQLDFDISFAAIGNNNPKRTSIINSISSFIQSNIMNCQRKSLKLTLTDIENIIFSKKIIEPEDVQLLYDFYLRNGDSKFWSPGMKYIKFKTVEDYISGEYEKDNKEFHGDIEEKSNFLYGFMLLANNVFRNMISIDRMLSNSAAKILINIEQIWNKLGKEADDSLSHSETRQAYLKAIMSRLFEKNN